MTRFSLTLLWEDGCGRLRTVAIDCERLRLRMVVDNGCGHKRNLWRIQLCPQTPKSETGTLATQKRENRLNQELKQRWLALGPVLGSVHKKVVISVTGQFLRHVLQNRTASFFEEIVVPLSATQILPFPKVVLFCSCSRCGAGPPQRRLHCVHRLPLVQPKERT